MELKTNQKNAAIVLTILIAIGVMWIGLVTNHNFLSALPSPPDLAVGNGRTPEAVKQDIENYKNLAAIIKENQSYLNELLVVRFLKTLFETLIAAVIAYVFGKPLVMAVSARIKGNRQP